MAHTDLTEDDLPPRLASSPCLAGEIAPDYFDPRATDPQQALDVARWRRAERKRLRAERQAMSVSARSEAATAIMGHLEALLKEIGLRGRVLSGYWPIKGEPDLRPLLTRLHAKGLTLALPVVEKRAAPLIFRRWAPGAKMLRGDWNIPVPPPEAEMVTPGIALVPCLGWTGDCFRLGWGGGYFDRTLAVIAQRPFTIGIALSAARLSTIYPQPHDIPLDLILTEDGVAAARTER